MATSRKPKPKTTVDRDALALAITLSDDHLLCRLVGHQWERVLPDRAPPFGRIVSWQCKRCLTLRDDIIAPATGDLLARTYRYPEGYKQTYDKSRGQGGRMPVPVLRLALMRRDDAQTGEG